MIQMIDCQLKAFFDYLAKHYIYPAVAKAQGIAGRIIFLLWLKKIAH